MANPTVIQDGLHVMGSAGGVTTAEEARRVDAGLLARSGSAGSVVARTGVIYSGRSSLLTGTSTVGPPMTVQVEPLHFVAAKAAGEGVYRGVVPAPTLVDVAAAPGSNSRIDVVYVAQQDATATTSPDAVTQGVVGVVTGTPQASPVKPAIPTGAVEVGTLRVFAGATTTAGGSVTISTTCQWTALVGCPIPVRDSTERAALTVYPGLEVLRLDTNTLERYNAGRSAWLANPGDRRALSADGAGFIFTAGYTDVAGATLSLPAGAWWVTATGATDVSTSAARTYYLRLWDGTTQLNLTSIASPSGLSRTGWSLSALVSYSSPTTVKLQAYTSAVDGTQGLYTPRIVAVPIADV